MIIIEIIEIIKIEIIMMNMKAIIKKIGIVKIYMNK